jgi:hypothetical protein
MNRQKNRVKALIEVNERYIRLAPGVLLKLCSLNGDDYHIIGIKEVKSENE